MSQSTPPRPLPKILVVAGSIFAVGHLLAIGLLALAAESGPWPTNFGMSSKALGPKFATTITEKVAKPCYLSPLHMTNDYHFKSNLPTPFATYFKVQLKNERGDVIKELTFPDEKANFWVRHRQSILAQELAQDQPVPMQMTEKIAAPGKEMATVEFWNPPDPKVPNVLRLESAPAHLVPRERAQPTEWSRLLAKAYMRHLCNEYQATSAELVRHSRQAIQPIQLFMNQPEAFIETTSYFGEYRREE